MEKKCHDCIHSRNITGDVHISCRHPVLDKLFDNPFAELITILGKRIGYGGMTLEAIKSIREINGTFEIEANEHGVNKGWFIWPFNFDPVWLENCNAFEEKACTPSENDI